MLYLHYCAPCRRIHILSGHRINCPACDATLAELKVAYTTYITWDTDERARYLEHCHDPASLAGLSTFYPHRKSSLPPAGTILCNQELLR